MKSVYIGTMGWAYEDWRGVFYSRSVVPARMLEEYATVFDAVELDTTFYGFPRPSTLESWAAMTPTDFLFSAKVPRAVTHERRLHAAAEIALDFGALLQAHLGPKLGAVLLQLPPDFTVSDAPVLRTFCEVIATTGWGADLPWVVEFRDDSWLGTDIIATLEPLGFMVATTERLDFGGSLRYLRLLGIENSVARFDERQLLRQEELATWTERIRAVQNGPVSNRPCMVHVRNFFEGHAPATLRELQRLLRPDETLPIPPGQRQMSLF